MEALAALPTPSEAAAKAASDSRIGGAAEHKAALDHLTAEAVARAEKVARFRSNWRGTPFELPEDLRQVPEQLGGMPFPPSHEFWAAMQENSLLLVEWQWLQAELAAGSSDFDVAAALQRCVGRFQENVAGLTRLMDQAGTPVDVAHRALGRFPTASALGSADFDFAALAKDSEAPPAIREAAEQAAELERTSGRKEPLRTHAAAPGFPAARKLSQPQLQVHSRAAPARAAAPPPNRWPASTRALAIGTPEVVTSMPTSPGEAEALQRAVHDLMLERVCFGAYSAATSVANVKSGLLAGHPATASGLLMAIRSGVPAARQLLDLLHAELASSLRSVHTDIRGSKAFTRFAWLVGFRDAASGAPWSGGFEEVMRSSPAIAKGTQSAAIDFARRVSASLMAAGDSSGADLYTQSAHVLSLSLIPDLGGLAVSLIHRPNARSLAKPEWAPLLNEIQRRAHEQRTMAAAASAHQQASAAAAASAAQFRAHGGMAHHEAMGGPRAGPAHAAGSMHGPRVVMPLGLLVVSSSVYAYIFTSLPNLMYAATDQDGPARRNQAQARSQEWSGVLAAIEKAEIGADGKEPAQRASEPAGGEAEEEASPARVLPIPPALDAPGTSALAGRRSVVKLRSGAFVEVWERGIVSPDKPTIVVMSSVPEAISEVFAALPTNRRCIAYRHAGAPKTWPLGGLQGMDVAKATGGTQMESFSKLMTVESRPGGHSSRLAQDQSVAGALVGRGGARVEDGAQLDSAISLAARGEIAGLRWKAETGPDGKAAPAPTRGLSAVMKAAGRDTNAVSARSVHGRPLATPDALAAELAGVLEALRVEDKVLIVSSHLDWLAAFRFAELNQDGVAGMVLLDPVLPWPAGPVPSKYPRVTSSEDSAEPKDLPDESRAGCVPSGLVYIPSELQARLDAQSASRGDGKFPAVSDFARATATKPADQAARPSLGTDDLLLLAQLEGGRPSAMATARGGKGSFVTGPNAPYAADSLAAAAARRKPPVPGAGAAPAGTTSASAVAKAIANASGKQDAQAAASLGALPSSLVSGQGVQRVVDSCSILQPKRGPAPPGLDKASLAALVDKFGPAALDELAGGVPVVARTIPAFRPTLVGDRRANGLHLPMAELAASHVRPILPEHLLFDRLVRHAVFAEKEHWEPQLLSVQPTPSPNWTLPLRAPLRKYEDNMCQPASVFLEEQVEALRAADYAVRLAVASGDATVMGREWGPPAAAPPPIASLPPHLQGVLTAPPIIRPPVHSIPEGQIPGASAAAAGSASLDDFVFTARANALHPPLNGSPKLDRNEFFRIRSTAPAVRMPWFGAPDHVEGLRYWLAQRAAVMPFPVRVVLTGPSQLDIANAPATLRATGLAASISPPQSVQDLRQVGQLLQGYYAIFWGALFPVNKVPAVASGALMQPKPDQVVSVVQYVSEEAGLRR
ncbi:hypothetical protein FNF29_07325 [Cafeteria roenbergensis]|uniref:Uncharacterized protein n=1 Tax=Cafeteria roenbergensis TaxID=33653 RepID=A0A5A8C4L5_CAFRO|nr:hypothetical protein FNF29_07325 [Cafeteria roenbergensis]|eukprot:KAA0147479.1 hypothetical protein FNF29_07325 [Cafeteria roenbergensis]